MKIYYPKDKNGNDIGFRTPEQYVFDTTGKSLTDKIAELNSNIAKRPLSSDVETFENTLTNRFNSAVTQLNSDSEVADARVGYDGTTYGSLHDAITSQVSNLQEKVTADLSGYIGGIVEHEYLAEDETIKHTETDWGRTEYIPCHNLKYINVAWTLLSGWNAFFDENKTFIKWFTIGTHGNYTYVTVPENAYYFMLSNKLTPLKTAKIATVYNMEIADNKRNIKKIYGDNAVIEIENWIVGAYIDDKTGAEIEYEERWICSDYYDIGDCMFLYGYCDNDDYPNYVKYNAFYDENKNYISTFSYVGLSKVPSNAKYIRISCLSYFYKEITLVKIPLFDGIKGLYEHFYSQYSIMPNKYIKELYLTGPIDTSKTLVIGQIRKNLFQNNKYYTGFGIGYADYGDNPDDWIASNDTKYENYNENSFDGATLVRVSPYGGSGISGYAVVDFTHCEEGKHIYPNIPINPVIVQKLEYSPTIAKYVNSMNIVELNKDKEPLIHQGTAKRARYFNDPYKPLEFIHLSDIHNKPVLWSRMVEYMNHYSDYIKFALHTGDYCGDTQAEYTDLYANSVDSINPVYNVIGNHDAWIGNKIQNDDKSVAHSLLFNHTSDWDVTWMPGDYSMTYYKDFPENNIRLIVLDYYYDLDTQHTWLSNVLDDAKTNGYHVITAMHEESNPIVNKLECTFQTINDYDSLGGNSSNESGLRHFDAIIKTFKDNGGIHVANLVGHEHVDMFGYTANGILNIAVECATTVNGWQDCNRITNARTYDSFNVVSVDANIGIIKLIRIGNHLDHYLREKNVMCYDYINKRIISNQ